MMLFNAYSNAYSLEDIQCVIQCLL